jgi:hypothetical protein
MLGLERLTALTAGAPANFNRFNEAGERLGIILLAAEQPGSRHDLCGKPADCSEQVDTRRRRPVRPDAIEAPDLAVEVVGKWPCCGYMPKLLTAHRRKSTDLFQKLRFASCNPHDNWVTFHKPSQIDHLGPM